MDLQGEKQDLTAEELKLRDLYLGEFDRLAALLGRLGVPQQAIQGVAQEAFLNAPIFTAGFDLKKPSFAWLLSIGFQAAANYWRRLHRASQQGRREAASAEESAEAAAIDLLKVGFERLPPVRRQVVELRDLFGLSVRRISETLGIPLATVYSHLRLGRRELAAVIHAVLSAAELSSD